MWKCKCTSNYTILHIKSGKYSMFIMMSYFDPLLVLYSWLSEPMLLNRPTMHTCTSVRNHYPQVIVLESPKLHTDLCIRSISPPSLPHLCTYLHPENPSIQKFITVCIIEKNYSSRISIHLHIWNMYMFSS